MRSLLIRTEVTETQALGRPSLVAQRPNLSAGASAAEMQFKEPRSAGGKRRRKKASAHSPSIGSVPPMFPTSGRDSRPLNGTVASHLDPRLSGHASMYATNTD